MYTPALVQYLESKLQAKIHLSWKLMGSGVFSGQSYAMEILAKTDKSTHDLDKILFIHWGKVKLVIQHNTLAKIFCHHCGSQRHPTNVCQTKYVVPEERIIRVSEELIQQIEETEWTWDSIEDFQANLRNPKTESQYNFEGKQQTEEDLSSQKEHKTEKQETSPKKKETPKTEKIETTTQKKETQKTKIILTVKKEEQTGKEQKTEKTEKTTTSAAEEEEIDGNKQEKNQQPKTPPTEIKGKRTTRKAIEKAQGPQTIKIQNSYSSLDSDSEDEDESEDEETKKQTIAESSINITELNMDSPMMAPEATDTEEFKQAQSPLKGNQTSKEQQRDSDEDIQMEETFQYEIANHEESKTDQVPTTIIQETAEATSLQRPKRRALTDAEQRQPPSKHARSQQQRCPLLQDRLQWKIKAQGHKQKMSLNISTPQEHHQIDDFFKANQLYTPAIPTNGHCLAYAITSALTMVDLKTGCNNEGIDPTLQGMATLVKFTPLWAYQQSMSETAVTCNLEFLRSRLKDPDKYGVSNKEPHQMLEQILTAYAVVSLKQPLPPDLWGGFDHLRLMASYFERHIFLMNNQQQNWVFHIFSPPEDEVRSATMKNVSYEVWKQAIQEHEAPIILVLDQNHYQTVLPISRKRARVPRLRPTRNTVEEQKSSHPILKLADMEMAYKLNNVSTILTAFQEDHLTIDARKELIRALDPENDRGEEGLIFYNEHIPSRLQEQVLQGKQLDPIISEYAEIQNISLQGAQAIISDYQQSLTQEEETSQQTTQDSDFIPEDKWVVFSKTMKRDWEKHKEADPHIPELDNKKDLKRFIGKFPQAFLYALRSQEKPFKFLQRIPEEMTAHWQDAIYAQSIYIQLQAIQDKNPNADIKNWIDKLGDPTRKRFSGYTKSFYQKLTLKSQWIKAKKYNYWGSEALAALDTGYLPQSKVLAIASELYGTRLPKENQETIHPADYLVRTMDLWESRQEEVIEEGLRDTLSPYVGLIHDRRVPHSPGY